MSRTRPAWEMELFWFLVACATQQTYVNNHFFLLLLPPLLPLVELRQPERDNRIMSDLRDQIVDYVKLKDRPSALELQVRKLNGEQASGQHMTITAPIENGKLVWKVGFNTPSNYPIQYDSSETIVMLIDGSFLLNEGSGTGLQLDVAYRSEADDAFSVARWRIEHDTEDAKKQATIEKALNVLVTM